MKVSGFTIIRNGNYYAYPYIEAIKSVLPLCDEFVINYGISNDGTLENLKKIESDKIKIINREWDMSVRQHASVLSVETNAAKEQCTGDWLFYIQADEVLHEKYIPVVQDAMEKYHTDKNVDGLRFWYKHFYGSFDYFQDNYRNWYIREIRVIKNKPEIKSVGDAMDFRYPDGSKLNKADIKAEIFHYGWVRPPQVMMQKRTDFERLYHEDGDYEKYMSQFTKAYQDLGNLKRFNDTHPKVMHDRIKESNWDFDAKLDEQSPDWIRKIKIFLHPLIKRIKK